MPIKYTIQSITEDAKKCTTKNEFKKLFNGSYQWACKNKVINNICSHMKNGSIKYTNEQIICDAKKYNSRYEWQKNSNLYYSAKYKGIDFLNICYEHMEIKNRSLSDNEIHKIALRYETRNEFIKADASAHRSAYERGILNDICSHMEYCHKQWDSKSVSMEAIKYKHRKDFAINNSSAYDYARRNRILNDICSHMTFKKSTFNYSKEAMLYYISIDNGMYYKIGITSINVNFRFSNESSNRIKVIFEKKFKTGYEAKQEERKILLKYKKHITKDKVLHRGNTEIFTFDVLGLDINHASKS